MNNLPLIEEFFNKCIKDLNQCAHDGVIEVDLELLHKMDLLDFHPGKMKKEEDNLTRYFHVVESIEKITLINDDFVIWIVPESGSGVAVTYTLIALNQSEKLKLELVFATSGVYNNSWLVLRILEKFLIEIQENEALISFYKKSA